MGAIKQAVWQRELREGRGKTNKQIEPTDIKQIFLRNAFEKADLTVTRNVSLLLYLRMNCWKDLCLNLYSLTDQAEKTRHFFCPKDGEVSNSFQARA